MKKEKKLSVGSEVKIIKGVQKGDTGKVIAVNHKTQRVSVRCDNVVVEKVFSNVEMI